MEKLFKGFLLLLLISCCFSQQPIACQVCQRAKQCDQSLLYDGNIDLIYNSMVQQLPISDYPLKIECVKTSTEATYIFSWANDVYQAIVDIKTRAYKVIKSDQNTAVKAVEGVQNALGVRDSSILQTNENIIARIDQDIRVKYFPGINVKCVSIVPGQGGYHAIYEKPDFKRVEYDAVLSTSGGNTFITYKACPVSTVVDSKPAQTTNQAQVYGNSGTTTSNSQGSPNIWFNVQQNPTPYTINPSQVTIKPVATAPSLQVQANPQVQVANQPSPQVQAKPQVQITPQIQTAPQPTIQVQASPQVQTAPQPQTTLQVQTAPQIQPTSQPQQTQVVQPSDQVADPTTAVVVGGYTQIQTNDEGFLKILNLLNQKFGSIISSCSIIKV